MHLQYNFQLLEIFIQSSAFKQKNHVSGTDYETLIIKKFHFFYTMKGDLNKRLK